jgi:hypothetical protein
MFNVLRFIPCLARAGGQSANCNQQTAIYFFQDPQTLLKLEVFLEGSATWMVESNLRLRKSRPQVISRTTP